jgi:putative tryptophan/tyrosine transport system substrate-binding protein
MLLAPCLVRAQQRIFCFAISGMLLALCPFAEAQQSKKVYRVGYLSPRLGIEPREEAFRQSMGELGYVEGQNLQIEWRFAKGKNSLFPELASDLVRSRTDCIVAVGVAAIRAVKQLSNTIPIVMGTIDADPVELGLVASLARPSGNITGFTGIAYDIAGKRLEFLKETVPKAARAAIFVASIDGITAQAHLSGTEVAARALKMQLQVLDVRGPEGLEKAFQMARKGRAEVLSVVMTSWINSHRPRIVKLAANTRLPAIYSSPDAVLEGGLMSYAADPVAQVRQVATYVDKIFKGTKPADLPVQQPTKFEFIINLKAAKQIGLAIPPNVLARADKVIR